MAHSKAVLLLYAGRCLVLSAIIVHIGCGGLLGPGDEAKQSSTGGTRAVATRSMNGSSSAGGGFAQTSGGTSDGGEYNVPAGGTQTGNAGSLETNTVLLGGGFSSGGVRTSDGGASVLVGSTACVAGMLGCSCSDGNCSDGSICTLDNCVDSTTYGTVCVLDCDSDPRLTCVVATLSSNCITGADGCRCFLSGACLVGRTCNYHDICVNAAGLEPDYPPRIDRGLCCEATSTSYTACLPPKA